MTSHALDEARERLRPHVERARDFSGWMNFPSTKLVGQELPWSYSQRVRELLADAASVLDMGTGGGERFATYVQGFTGRVVATEEWPPNVPIASERLRSLGAQVVHSRSLVMPFAGASFDLVLNRHEELEPAEVARVLRPGGSVLTQQVEGDNWTELRPFFPRKTDFGDHFARYCDEFEEHGLTVRHAQEFDRIIAYESLGDLVFMLCITPWTIPDFDPLGADLPALLEAERRLSKPDGIVVTEGRYMVEARKP